MIQLQDIDYNLGHSLVHYLYTDDYQSLNRGTTGDEFSLAIGDYKYYVQLYCVASIFKLPGLQDLVIGKIKLLEFDIPIGEVLSSAEEVFHRLPDEDTWYPKDLTDRLRTAYKHASDFFKSSTFLDCFAKTSKLNIFLVRALVQIYSELLEGSSKPNKALGEECLTEDTPVEKLTADREKPCDGEEKFEECTFKASASAEKGYCD
jgi:hypothetical protein